MKIQIFGSGCPSCKKLFDLAKQAALESNLGAEVEYITNIQQIVDAGVMSTPALVVDGKILVAGQIPSVEKIKEILANVSGEKKSCGGCGCRCGHN